MSRYHGRCGKGFGRLQRQLKREEAEERSKLTLHPKTKAHRLARCECATPAAPRRKRTRKGKETA